MNILLVGQLIISIALVGLIAIQGKGGGLGSTFGSAYTAFSKRRGIEKSVFYLTIGCSVLFLVFSVANLFV